MKIPIGNLYFMLSYAWNMLDDFDQTMVAPEAYQAPVDLLASILVSRVERLLRSGLNRGYQTRTEELLGLRGRIDIGRSVKSRGMQLGHLVCEFDELDYSVLHNQIIRATLLRLCRTRELNQRIAADVARLERRFSHIEMIRLSDGIFSKVTLHRNTSQYRLAINICELLYRQLIPVGRAGQYTFKAFTENRISALFEEFLRSFYKREQSCFVEVKRERFRWQASAESINAMEYLPSMETDISLLAPGERLVVEAKFYAEALRSKYSDSRKKFFSGHLYQVSAYLRNLSAFDKRISRGLLIYPLVEDEFDYQYELLGHRVRVAAIDLTQPAKQLRDRLLALIEPTAPDLH